MFSAWFNLVRPIFRGFPRRPVQGRSGWGRVSGEMCAPKNAPLRSVPLFRFRQTQRRLVEKPLSAKNGLIGKRIGLGPDGFKMVYRLGFWVGEARGGIDGF